MVSKCNPSDIFESYLYNVITNILANDYFGKLFVDKYAGMIMLPYKPDVWPRQFNL
jgi:hypothetical protein